MQRGFAEWVEFDVSIRFKKDNQIRQELHAEAERRYWDDLARQRGGTTDVFCMWQAKMSGGYNVMQASVGVESE